MENDFIKILAIDDNLDNLITLQALTSEAFPTADIIIALTGEEGLNLAAAENPDVILLDIIMPGMDGFEVCTRLKSDKNLCDIPVIFVTALKGDKESRIKGLEVGAEAFLAKPIDESELIAQIRAMLKIRKATLERKSETQRLELLVAEKTNELKKTHKATLNLLEDLQTEIETRKQTEEALRQSEALYRSILDASPDDITLTDLEGNILMISPKGLEFIGYKSLTELKGTNFIDILIPEDRERALLRLDEMFNGRSIGPEEFKIITKNGDIVETEINAEFVRDENGDPNKIIFAIRDITERKLNEEALRDSEQKFRDMANLLPQIVFELDNQGRITYVNEQVYTFLGYKTNELLGEDSFITITPDDKKKGKENLKLKIEGKNTDNNNYTMQRKDGSTFPALVYSNPIVKNGEYIGIRGIVVDITDQKKSEELIRESEKKYRLITEKISDVVWILDLNGKSQFVSQSIENFTGYTVDEYLGQTIDDRFTPKSAEIAKQLLESEVTKYLKNKPKKLNFRKTLILEYKCKNGDVKFGELLITPYLDEEEQLIGIHGVTRDITVRKLTENKLLESEALYRAILEASPDFIIITDLTGCIQMASPSAIYKYGYNDISEVIGKNITDFTSGEDKERMYSDFKKVTLGIRTGPNEYKSLAPHGKSFDIEVKGGIIHDINGNISKLVFNARDITERKLAQEALEKSEAKYREFVENSPEAIALYSNGIVNYVNKECLRLLRATHKEQLIGMPVINFIHPDNRAGVFKRMNEMDLTAMDLSFPLIEEKYICLDGTSIYVELKVMPLMVDDVPSVQLTARDITERKIVQEALIESENRYNTFIDNNVDMIFVKDDQFRYLIINDAMAKFYQRTKAEILHKTDSELADDKIIAPCVSSDQEALTATAAFITEEKIGDKIYETIKFPMQLKNNKKGIGGIMRDITKRKNSEKALENSQKELQTIYDHAPVMMCLVDEDRKIMFANDAFTSLIDNKQEFVNNRIGDIIGCFNAQEKGCGLSEKCINCNLRIAIDDTFKTGKGHRNIDYVRSDGKTEISLLGSTAVINHNNQKNLLLCLNDITTRKMAEDALQKSEMLLRTFIDNSPFEIWARDNENIGILENKKFVDHYGSIIGFTPDNDKRIDSKTAQTWRKINDRAFTGETVDEEYEFIINNEKRLYQQIIFPIKNISKIIGIAGFNIDITERKNAEKALKESQEMLKKFAAHLQNIREEERVLLAREIHDELGQILVAVKIDMGILKNEMSRRSDKNDSPDIMRKFDDLVALVDKTIKTARKIMTDLRPEVLELLGFSEAVKLHTKNFEERFKAICKFNNLVPNYEFSSQQSIALFRIIQEALNNVAKHAKATEVKIDIYELNNDLILEIKDNGIGFDQNNKKHYESYGIIGMKERVFLLDGELTISSKKDRGTKIQIKLPSNNNKMVG